MRGSLKSRVLGKVVSVTAGSITVELHGGSDNFTTVDFEDVRYIATLGSYLLVAIQLEMIVLEVVGLREKDSGSDRQKTTEMNKLSSVKFLDTVPIGTIPMDGEQFIFGVTRFPPLYADVVFAGNTELDQIFNVKGDLNVVTRCNSEGDRFSGTVPSTIEIGTSSVFKDYPVKVRLNSLFGGHFAVLGNTGSGKSCTVASIIQSIFSKPESFHAIGATLIVFDVNGEYSNSLSKFPIEICVQTKKFQEFVEQKSPVDDDIILPPWFLTVNEWALFLRASELSQIPVLRMALGFTSIFSNPRKGKLIKLKNHILAKIILGIMQSDDGSGSKANRVHAILSRVCTDEINLNQSKEPLSVYYGEFRDSEKSKSSSKFHRYLEVLNGYLLENVNLPAYDNLPFTLENLKDSLNWAIYYEEASGNKRVRDFCAPMMTRLESIANNPDYGFMRFDAPKAQEKQISPQEYIDDLIGIKIINGNYEKISQIQIINLNDASDDVVELISTVISRLLFDRMRKSSKRNSMPVHLVFEEAHRYIPNASARSKEYQEYTLHRIAKEGRKFGVFIILASQRPSEISDTVLSQCSNYIVHKIQNPVDLNYIRKVTPFISENVIQRLPSMPKQHALIFGNSVNIPQIFRVRDADPIPYSDDASIEYVWYVPVKPIIP